MTRSAGFSVIEALIAAGVLATVALGVAQLFAMAVAHNDAARQQLVMGLAAAAKIDELSTLVAAGPAETPADALERTVDGCSDAVVESGRRYVRRWRIAEVAGYGASAYAIAVRVLPAAGTGADVRLTTIRAGGAP
jgi:type II secretory pathway pseudopilin PulG